MGSVQLCLKEKNKNETQTLLKKSKPRKYTEKINAMILGKDFLDVCHSIKFRFIPFYDH